MVPSSFFGEENEKFATHIKTTKTKGFPLTIDDIRKTAHDFVEQLNLKDRLHKETEKAISDSS